MAESSSRLTAKIAAVLAAVSDYGQGGARLVDVARDTGVARPSVHRILTDLALEGLITRRADRKYTLGPAALALGLSAPTPLGDLDAIDLIVRELADFTTVTCYVAVLLRRRALYVARAQGSSPVHVHSVEVGETRPLVTTHGGIALLATLPEREQERFLTPEVLERTRVQQDIPLSLSVETIREKIQQVRDDGFLYGQNLTTPGIAGMAAPVYGKLRAPFVAVTIAATNDHLSESTAAAFAPRLLRAASKIAHVVDAEM